MKYISKSLISSLLLLAFIVACGDSNDSNKKTTNSRQNEEATDDDGTEFNGTYKAKFGTLNSHVNGTIPGSATFFRTEDRLYVFVRLFAGGPKAWHMQNVYTGRKCPTMKDDLNKDGFLDIQEAEKVLGKRLIPLDSDISSQTSGSRFFPLADLSGYYHYERITSYNRFLADLKAEDKDPTDDLIKLMPDEDFRISGKAVMVLGITETIQLPETVASKGRHQPFQTFPIACGIFKKIEDIPGEIYTDEIPGPVAEVEEGQDRPADEETPEGTTGGETSGSTSGGSNESDDGNGPISDGEGGTTGGTSGTSSTSGSSTTSTTTTTTSSSSSSSTGGSEPGPDEGESSSGDSDTPPPPDDTGPSDERATGEASI